MLGTAHYLLTKYPELAVATKLLLSASGVLKVVSVSNSVATFDLGVSFRIDMKQKRKCFQCNPDCFVLSFTRSFVSGH